MLIGKHTGKRPLGRPRRGWENNIGMDLKEEVVREVDTDYWRTDVNATMNPGVP